MSTDDPTSQMELVRVLSIRDPAAIAVAKSLLDEAEIEYDVRGEQLQNLGIPALGPVEFWVFDKDAESALELLGALAAR